MFVPPRVPLPVTHLLRYASALFLMSGLPHSSGSFNLSQVSNNAREFSSGVESSSDAIVLEFVSVRLVDLLPFSGPIDGGTSVTLVGHGFHLGGLGCRFGESALVPASRASAYRIRCTSPTYHATGWVTVELQSFYGIAESASAFFYLASLSNIAAGSSDGSLSGDGSASVGLAPTRGPVDGEGFMCL